MKPTFQEVGLLMLLGALSSTETLHAARTAPLRYHPTAGQTNVYNIRIEVRGENGTDILAGNILFLPKAGPSNLVTVTLRGTLQPRRENPRPMMGGNFPRWMSPVYLYEGCEIQMDDRGRILRSAGDYPLPVPLGSVAQLLVETLPEPGTARWETTEHLNLLDDPILLGPAAAFSSASPFGMSYYGGFNPRSGTALLTGLRTSSFKIKAAESGTVALDKTSRLKTDLRHGADARVEGGTEGALVLDRETGFLRETRFQFTSTVNTETLTRRTAGSVEIQLLEGKERETALAALVPAPAPPARKLTAEEMQKLLQDVKSDDTAVQQQAANRLGTSELTNPPEELIELAAGWASQSDSPLRMAGIRLLADYGTKDQVPLLLRQLKENDPVNRSTILRGLGRLKDPRAAAPLARIVARGFDTYQAAETLGKLGSQAEEPVLALLKEKHLETLRTACNILKQIGTGRSLEPLRELMLDPDSSLNSSAAEAIRAIQARE